MGAHRRTGISIISGYSEPFSQSLAKPLRVTKPLRSAAAFVAVLVLNTVSIPTAMAQSILPPAPGAIGGGNPLQGLGRKDDPSPPRYDDFLPKTSQIDSSSSDAGSDSTSSAGGTEALEKTLDANGLKLQDVPKLINNLQQESAKVAGEAGIEMGGNEGTSGLSRSGSGLGGSSLDIQPLASPLTAPPVASPGDPGGQDSGSFNGSESADSSIAGLSGSQSDSKPPGTLNTEGEYENGPAGLPPGPGLPSLSDGKGSSQQAGAVSSNMRLKSPRAQEVTDKIRAALSKQTPKRNETSASRHGLVPAPPPVMPFSQHQSRDANTPERQALQMINKGEYAAAEDQLRDVVSNDPTNLHARYLLAVALVHRKNYDEARTQYNLIIQKSQDTRLIELATTGLEKIGR